MALTLTPRQRDVLLLKCRDGLTNAETGYALRIREQTVKNLVFDATETNGMNVSRMCWALARETLEAQTGENAPPASSVSSDAPPTGGAAGVKEGASR